MNYTFFRAELLLKMPPKIRTNSLKRRHCKFSSWSLSDAEQIELTQAGFKGFWALPGKKALPTFSCASFFLPSEVIQEPLPLKQKIPLCTTSHFTKTTNQTPFPPFSRQRNPILLPSKGRPPKHHHPPHLIHTLPTPYPDPTQTLPTPYPHNYPHPTHTLPTARERGQNQPGRPKP